MIKKKVLFIDRDGTIIREPFRDLQVDSFEKLEFTDEVISTLKTIAQWQEFELVLVTNQDGLGTESFPLSSFTGPHKQMLNILGSEGVFFSEELIDSSFPYENSPNRKPRTGMLTKYFGEEYDLENSFVIGDRYTDVELAKNLGCKAFLIFPSDAGNTEISFGKEELDEVIVRKCTGWKELLIFLRNGVRTATVNRKSAETDIRITLDLDGSGKAEISTGIAFFDHMLEQIARHGQIDLSIKAAGDLQVDEHHTIEDTAIVLGQAFDLAFGSKRGIDRYGFALPMDESFTLCAIDFGGRAELIWDVSFYREYVGELPTEMVKHFFKTFCASAKCNIFVKTEGENEHHKIESIFKAFAKAILMAKRRESNPDFLPSTKNLFG